MKNADATVTSLRRTSEQAERSVDEIGTAARRLNEKGGALDKLAEGGAALAAGRRDLQRRHPAQAGRGGRRNRPHHAPAAAHRQCGGRQPAGADFRQRAGRARPG